MGAVAQEAGTTYAVSRGADARVLRTAQVVDEQSLPTFLGGKDTSCNFVNEKGPWAHLMPDVCGTSQRA